MAERIFSEGLVLPDGRKVRVLAYDDGSVRFRVDGTPYVLEEAFLSGGTRDHAILKLGRRNGHGFDNDSPEGDPLMRLRAAVVDLKNQLDDVSESPGDGRIVRRHHRQGIEMGLTTVLTFIDSVMDPDAD